MFDELSASDEALALGTSELPAGADILASRLTARHARDKDDLLVLLDALGLPTDTDATTALLPLIPTPDPAVEAVDPEPSGDQPVMPHSPASVNDASGVDAFEAVAVSMHHGGYPTEAITEATGLTEEEITAAVAAAAAAATADDDAAPATTAAEPETAPDPAPNDGAIAEGTVTSTPKPTVLDVADVDVLLPWAEQHPLPSVRATAARIRHDLADLAARRDTEQAAAEVEARIAKLRADLQAEEEHLRQLRVGSGRTATTEISATHLPRAGKRSREELAAIRTWARENGHQVGTAGVIKASIVAAYDAAHQQPATLAKAG